MDALFKKASFSSVEDFAKEIIVKKNLSRELGRSIRAVQEDSLEKSVITDDETSSSLCYVLEAIFIHGLKDKFIKNNSTVFGGSGDKIPEPQFWSMASSYSHKNVISDVQRFDLISSDVGRGRAWLRAALNEGLIVSYISTMLADASSLQKWYTSTAYMRDAEHPDIMKQLLEGISMFSFELSCNDSTLNVWNSMPLTLANLWTPPVTPQPVMPAVDVIDFFNYSKNQPKVITKKAPASSDVSVKESDPPPPVVETSELVLSDPIPSQSHEADIHVPEAKEDELPIVNLTIASMEDHNSEETSSKISSSDSVPDFGAEFDVGSPTIGNRLNENSGWSSSFDCESGYEVDQSYDSLLQSYNKNLSKTVIGTPELSDTFSSAMGKNEDDLNDYSPDTKSPDLDFEIVPKYFSTEHADPDTKKLMSIFGQLCHQMGMDKQNFQCNSCGRPIGLIYGKARLCHYDGYNYCYECHDNEEECIPAKIVHNWDFNKYPVSKRSKVFLSRVEKDPLLNMKELNPEVYTAVEEAAQVQLLRTQLTFLRSYVFTCKQSVADELRMRLWPREYLFEHVHLYALDDLLQIPTGQLAQTLQKAIAFAKKHVAACQLCLLKGFICEVCNNSKAIYPFDIECTYHCDRCLAVYHATCMDANKYCPKCIRRLKRQQALEAAASD